jgi:AcrR family transcriptional regulator/DNA-binding MarR family transcriptional regulator
MAAVQRSRLLSAMFEVSAERGVAQVTVSDIVARAGVSRRTFYELFSDCGDCLLAAFDDAADAASERVIDAYRSCPPQARWHVRIRAALEGLLAFLDDEPRMARLLIVESLAAGPALSERRCRALEPAVAELCRQSHNSPGSIATELTAEAIVGAVLSVLHTRILEGPSSPLAELATSLMSMIVLPYLGPAAARRELAHKAPARAPTATHAANPLETLEIRVTYRTTRVLRAIGDSPGASNRGVGEAAGMVDQGQVSKLLSRLRRAGLIENVTGQQVRGAANAWRLTPRGERLYEALGACVGASQYR